MARYATAADFWASVEQGPDCWLWQGTRNPEGYGMLWWGGRVIGAHRVSVRLSGRVQLPGQVVRHTCDNPPCVNPAHLLVGTSSENIRDAYERGRMPFPSATRWEQLTADEITGAFDRREAGEPVVTIARTINVRTADLADIFTGKKFGDLTAERRAAWAKRAKSRRVGSRNGSRIDSRVSSRGVNFRMRLRNQRLLQLAVTP